MIAGNLRKGDEFVAYSRDEWDGMKTRERKDAKRVRVTALGPECRHDRTRVHLRTTHGDWCIPFVAEVLLVQEIRAFTSQGTAA